MQNAMQNAEHDCGSWNSRSNLNWLVLNNSILFNHQHNVQFRVDIAIKLLPKLASEQEIETSRITFEQIAELNKLPKAHWVIILQTQLIRGKGFY